MEWKKHWAKQKVNWAREDIAFSTECEKDWRKGLVRHMKKKHEGKFSDECKTCGLWREIIENEKKIRLKSKKQIREILRGEW